MFNNQQLIQNEEEFLRLNSEIDLKTKILMEQIDEVMKYQAAEQEEISEKWSTKKSRDENSKSPDLTERDIEIAYNKIFKPADKDPQGMCNGSLTESNDTSEPENGDSIIRDGNVGNSKSCHSAGVRTSNMGFIFPGKIARHRSEIKLKDKGLDSVLPESLKGMGQDNIVRFLKAKVKVLSEQLEILHSDEKKHVERIKELQTDRERVAEDRDKWIQQANIAKNVLVKHEQHASNIVTQMQNIQAENGHLKREVEKLKKELKQITQNSGSNEVRLNRSIEEVEKLKSSLRQAKQDEKDLKEVHRKKTEELSGAVRRLDKQRIELLHAFKKQLVIIDNLKKQKGLVEAGKFVRSVEDDFMEFLDWNPGNS